MRSGDGNGILMTGRGWATMVSSVGVLPVIFRVFRVGLRDRGHRTEELVATFR